MPYSYIDTFKGVVGEGVELGCINTAMVGGLGGVGVMR